MRELLTIQDFFIVPFLLIVCYFIATRIKNKHRQEEPYYKYFRIGLFVKIWAGLAFAAIYMFYYGGGDTQYYFTGTRALSRMLIKDAPTFFSILFGNNSPENLSMFDYNTGWPTYFRDPNSWAVCRFNIPIYWLSFGSFLGNTILMNLFLFFGLWRFYKMLVELYPGYEKWMAYAIFFIPSVVFWSSGILKDGWMLSMLLLILSCLYWILIKKEKRIYNVIILLISSYISFSIRPFMLYATIGSGLLWIGFELLKTMESAFLKTIALPIIALVFWALGTSIFLQIGTLAGERYESLDSMLETAQVIQDDLKKEYYGGNSFDIGSFDPTLGGVIRKAPSAIIAGAYRPFLWEGDGPLMLFSGLENLILLLLTFYIAFKYRLFGVFRQLLQKPFLLAIFTLAITFAFSMGLTTANFGALVRYAIPVKLLLGLTLIVLFQTKQSITNASLDKASDTHYK